jgi:hypothetical protein
VVSFTADFPKPSYELSNPQLAGSERIQDLLTKSIANQLGMTNYGIAEKYGRPSAEQELKNSILKNAHQELINKYYAHNIESEISHRGALTNQVNTLLPMETRAKELANVLKQKEIESPESLAKPGSIFRGLPSDYKASYLSSLKAMGYNDQEAARAAYEDKDLGDMAQAKGYQRDLSDVPQAKPALTGASRTALTRSNLATAGLNAADEFINKGIANYAGQASIHGTPLGFYKDALLGKNKDKQADFIAASTLAQDQAFLRARQAGAPLSQGLLQHTLQTSLTHTRASLPFTSPDVFLEASKKIKKAFDDINAAENVAAFGGSSSQKSQRSIPKSSEELSDEDIEHTAKRKGISPDEVRSLLKLGRRR